MLSKTIQEDLDRIINHKLDWNVFANSTVLISGAAGFLPAYMVETLLRLNDIYNSHIKVIALVRSEEKALKRFSHYKGRPDLELLIQDVCVPVNLPAISQIDYIIHAASHASPKFYGQDPVGTISPNIIGTTNLLNLAKEKSTRGFLFFSSGEVYGETKEGQIPTKESDYGYMDPMNVRSCYGESKRMGETLCVSWQHQYGIPVKIVRPFHTYGPGMSLNDGRVFADFVSDIVNNRDIVMKSEGTNTRAFCYIADAVLGFFTVLLEGDIGEAYNVGFDKETSIIELANTLAGLFPEKRLRVIRNEDAVGSGFIKNPIVRTCPDISKIKALGWEPKTELITGFKRTIMSY